MFKKALVALALICAPASGAFAQTAGQSVSGFLLAPAGTYNGYTCPSSNVGPCFVQYGSSIPTTSSSGTITTITNPVGVKGADGSTIASSANPLNILPGQALGITPTDRTITSATGASQQVMAANSSRHSLIIQNTGSSNCGINPTGGTAIIGGAGTLTLLPGGSYQPRIPTLSAVTAICTAAQPLYAEEN